MNDDTTKTRDDFPARVKEWKATSGERLTGHELYLQKCQWKGILYASDPAPMRFWCRRYDSEGDGEVMLHGCLVDTSQRVEDVCLVQQLTYHDTIIAVNCRILMFPFEPSQVDSSGSI